MGDTPQQILFLSDRSHFKKVTIARIVFPLYLWAKTNWSKGKIRFFMNITSDSC